ncbi:hypothetical protein [Rhizobium ruizarguesonis]|uniref:hypothetical protein n=1 Tax=Rhizobium ruizarguesonis TaxID=2081791 RepID=UPI0013EF40E6|nr:hypothetical protein [Rhizobium ruizarguesonis]
MDEFVELRRNFLAVSNPTSFSRHLIIAVQPRHPLALHALERRRKRFFGFRVAHPFTGEDGHRRNPLRVKFLTAARHEEHRSAKVHVAPIAAGKPKVGRQR